MRAGKVKYSNPRLTTKKRVTQEKRAKKAIDKKNWKPKKQNPKKISEKPKQKTEISKAKREINEKEDDPNLETTRQLEFSKIEESSVKKVVKIRAKSGTDKKEESTKNIKKKASTGYGKNLRSRFAQLSRKHKSNLVDQQEQKRRILEQKFRKSAKIEAREKMAPNLLSEIIIQKEAEEADDKSKRMLQSENVFYADVMNVNLDEDYLKSKEISLAGSRVLGSNQFKNESTFDAKLKSEILKSDASIIDSKAKLSKTGNQFDKKKSVFFEYKGIGIDDDKMGFDQVVKNEKVDTKNTQQISDDLLTSYQLNTDDGIRNNFILDIEEITLPEMNVPKNIETKSRHIKTSNYNQSIRFDAKRENQLKKYINKNLKDIYDQKYFSKPKQDNDNLKESIFLEDIVNKYNEHFLCYTNKNTRSPTQFKTMLNKKRTEQLLSNYSEEPQKEFKTFQKEIQKGESEYFEIQDYNKLRDLRKSRNLENNQSRCNRNSRFEDS